MKAAVIYDANGVIYNIIYGAEELPPGLLSMWVDIPEGAQLVSIDVSDPAHPEPVFAEPPESDIGILQDQMTETMERVAILEKENEERIEDIVELDYRQAMTELGL